MVNRMRHYSKLVRTRTRIFTSSSGTTAVSSPEPTFNADQKQRWGSHPRNPWLQVAFLSEGNLSYVGRSLHSS